MIFKDEQEPFQHLRAGEGRVFIIADHASNRVPAALAGLGLDAAVLRTHIAYDPGTFELAHALSAQLSCQAVLSNTSRLVIDKNRRVDQEGLIPEVSDGIIIPANQNLSATAVAHRKDQYFHCYHDHIEAALKRTVRPFVLSLHSFTPQMNGHRRPWDCGLLYNKDGAMARRAIAYFESLGLCVGDNEPYPGHTYNATMDRHAEANGHPYLLLEIRNDLIHTPDHIAAWAERIRGFLATL